jgi:hypothetical protein
MGDIPNCIQGVLATSMIKYFENIAADRLLKP